MAVRVAILGAGGCFGQNLAMHLAGLGGYEVLGIGRAQPKAEPFTLGFDFDYRVRHLVRDFSAAWLDLRNFAPAVVVNFAAQAGYVPQSWTYAEEYFETNTMLPVRLAARLHCRLIQIGSSEVYGSSERPLDESAPIRCSSPYAVSKAAADLHLLTLSHPATILRPSNCYCPGQALHRLIPRAVVAGLTGKKMPLNGNPRRSFLHALDLSRAIELLIRKNAYGVFNAGPEVPFEIREVVGAVARAMDLRLDDIAEPAQAREVEDDCYWIDSSKIRRLGWEQGISPLDGIADMVAWGRRYLEQLRGLPIEYQFRP